MRLTRLCFVVALTAFVTAYAQSDGHALYFDGANDYVQVLDTDELDFGTGDFTISLWVKTTQVPAASTYPMLISKDISGSNRTGYEVYIAPSPNSGNVGFNIYSGGAGTGVTSSNAINDGEWHHIAAVKTITNLQIFVDGNLEGTISHTIGSTSNDLPLKFGQYGSGQWPLRGLMNEVRIWRYARTQGEIQADMNQVLTGAEDSLAAYWQLDEGEGQVAEDLAGNNPGRLGNNDIGDIGDPMWMDAAFPYTPSPGNALLFDGVDDYLHVLDTDELDFGTGDFTISLWIKTTQVPAANTFPVIIGKDDQNIPFRTGYDVFLTPGSDVGKVAFTIWSQGVSAVVKSSTLINDGNWHHIAAVKATTSLELFVDGVSENIIAHSIGSTSNDTPLNLGRHPSINAGFYRDLINEVRIWRYARTQSEIQADMNRLLTGTEDNLVAYWRLDEGEGQVAEDLAGNNPGRLGINSDTDISDPMWVNAFQPSIVGAIHDMMNTPVKFYLSQNYPNPFNPSTTIEFSLPKAALVTLTIYNVAGQKVTTLLSEQLPAGSYQYQWDARGLASGVYIYRMEAANFTQGHKMLLIR